MITSPISSRDYLAKIRKSETTIELVDPPMLDVDDVQITQVKYARLESWSTCFTREGRRLFPRNHLRIVDYHRIFQMDSRYPIMKRRHPFKFRQVMGNPDIRRMIIEMLDRDSIQAVISVSMSENCTWLYTYFINTRLDPWIHRTSRDTIPLRLWDIVNKYAPIKHARIHVPKITHEARTWILEHRAPKGVGMNRYHSADYFGCINTIYGHTTCTPGSPCDTALCYWITFHIVQREFCWRQLVAPTVSRSELIETLNDIYDHKKGDSFREQLDTCSKLEQHNYATNVTGLALEQQLSPVEKFGTRDKYEHFEVRHLHNEDLQYLWEKNALDAQRTLNTRLPGTLLVGYGIRPTICGWKAQIGGKQHLHLKVVLRRIITYMRPNERIEGEDKNIAYWVYDYLQSNTVWDLDGKVCEPNLHSFTLHNPIIINHRFI